MVKTNEADITADSSERVEKVWKNNVLCYSNRTERERESDGFDSSLSKNVVKGDPNHIYVRDIPHPVAN